MCDWKPIETAPLKQRVLVYCPKKRGYGIYIAVNTTGKQWWAPNKGAVHPSHWARISLPLKPPTVAEA